MYNPNILYQIIIIYNIYKNTECLIKRSKLNYNKYKLRWVYYKLLSTKKIQNQKYIN